MDTPNCLCFFVIPFKLMATFRLFVIYVKEDNDSDV